VSTNPESTRKKGLGLTAIGLTILAIALGSSGSALAARRGLLTTLLILSLALVLLGGVATLSAAMAAGDSEGRSRTILAAAVPVTVVAVTAILAASLYIVSSARVGVPVVDDASIDWSAATRTDLRIASIFGALSESGVGPALDRLEELAAEDEAIRARGHGIAHAVGRYAIQNNGYDADVFGECREIFQSGCYHGVLEAYFEGKPDVNAATVAGLCGSMVSDGRPPIEAVECAHGLGHGLTVRFDFDLAEALDRCGYLEWEMAREECFDGVFMENAVHGAQPRVAGGDPQHGDTEVKRGSGGDGMPMSGHTTDRTYRGMFRPDDPTYPCGEFDQRYQRACWAYQYMTVLRLNRNDVLAAFGVCDGAPPEGTAACYLGLGKRVGWEHEDSDPQIVETCGAGKREHLDDCLQGAMEYFMDSSFDAGRALQLCRAAPPGSRSSCFRALGHRVGLVSVEPDEVEEVCRGAGENAGDCLAGARRET
jgi:hypothetical protein